MKNKLLNIALVVLVTLSIGLFFLVKHTGQNTIKQPKAETTSGQLSVKPKTSEIAKKFNPFKEKFVELCDQFYVGDIGQTVFESELDSLQERVCAVGNTIENITYREPFLALDLDITGVKTTLLLKGYDGFLEEYEEIKRRYK